MQGVRQCLDLLTAGYSPRVGAVGINIFNIASKQLNQVRQ